MSKQAKFDRSQVIEKATNLYWEKGFSATSMRNLQDVIDMHPGSIYASFGSKEGLFSEVLAHYTHEGLTQLEHCFRETGSPIAALKQFMTSAVIDSRDQAPSCMCMLAKTVAELTDEHEDLLRQAKASLALVEEEFKKLIIIAQARGEVKKCKDPSQLARHIQVQMMGLRTYARACDGDAPLAHMIEDVFNHYPF